LLVLFETWCVCVCVSQMAILIEHIMINHQMLDYPIFRHTLPWVLMTVWICIVSVVSSMKEHWWMMSILWTRASLLSFKSLLDFQHFCHQHPHCKDCSVDSIILIFALGWSHIWPTNMLIHSSDFTCFFCAFFFPFASSTNMLEKPHGKPQKALRWTTRWGTRGGTWGFTLWYKVVAPPSSKLVYNPH